LIDSIFEPSSTNTNCRITECELKAEGCINSYPDATPTDPPQRLLVDENKVYVGAANLNVPDGWAETFCLKCYNGFQVL
jgi:hypothetical protein